MNKIFYPLLGSVLSLGIISAAGATTYEPIEGGHIAFESGEFDTFSFNADITNATVVLTQGAVINIDRIIAISRVDEEEGVQYIDRLLFSGIEFNHPLFPLEIDHFEIRDAVSTTTINWGSISGLVDPNGVQFARELSIKGVNMPTVAGHMTLAKLSAIIETDDDPLELREGELTVNLNGLSISDIPALELQTGLKTVNIDALYKNSTEKQDETYTSDDVIEITVQNLVKLAIQGQSKIAVEMLEKILAFDEAAEQLEDQEAAMKALFQSMAYLPVPTANIEITDLGGLEQFKLLYAGQGDDTDTVPFASVDTTEPTSTSNLDLIILNLEAFLTGYVPTHAGGFITAIRNWIFEGGTISTSITPTIPVTYGEAIALVTAGKYDEALTLLAVEMKQ